MPSAPSMTSVANVLPEELQSSVGVLGAALQRVSELCSELCQASGQASSGRASVEGQVVEMVRVHREATRRLEQQLESAKARAADDLAALREEMDAELTKCQATAAAREAALKQAHQDDVSELTERAQKQLVDRKRSHEEEVRQLAMVHDAEKSALTVKHATEMKKLASEMQTVVEEHATQLTALRAALEGREGVAAQRAAAERERLELGHREELGLVRQDFEAKLAELRAQLSLAAQGSAEVARKEAGHAKEKDSWMTEREDLLDQHQLELSARENRILQLEQALSQYESELSERNELQRSLATLMSRANNLLGPNSATPASGPRVPPLRKPYGGLSARAASPFRTPNAMMAASARGPTGSLSSRPTSPVLDFEVEKENASPLALV